MSKLFRQASRLNKTSFKFSVVVTVESIRLHPVHHEKNVVVVLSKGSNKMVCTPRPRKPIDAWGDHLNMTATLYRDKHGRYQEKKYEIYVKEGGPSGKTLATFKFDASQFVVVGGMREATELRVAKGDATLKVTMCCTFLQQSDFAGSEASSMISSHSDEREHADDGSDSMEQDLSGYEDQPRSARTESPHVDEGTPLHPTTASTPRRYDPQHSSSSVSGSMGGARHLLSPTADPLEVIARLTRQLEKTEMEKKELEVAARQTHMAVQRAEVLQTQLEEADRLLQEKERASEDKRSMSQRVLDLEGEKLAAVQQQVRAKKEIEELQRRVAEAEQQSKAAASEVEKALDSCKHKHKDLAHVTAELAGVKGSMIEAGRERDEARAELQAVSQARSKAEAELTSLRRYHGEIKLELEKAKNELWAFKQGNSDSNSLVDAFKTKLAEVEGQKAELRSEVDGLNAQLQHAQEDARKWEKLAQQREREKQDAVRQVGVVRDEADALHKRVKEAEGGVGGLRRRVEELEDGKAAVSQQFTQLGVSMQTLEDERRRAMSDGEAARKRSKSLVEQLQEEEAVRGKLETVVAGHVALQTSLEADVRNFRAQLQKAVDDNAAKEKTLHRLQLRVLQCQGEAQVATEDKARAESELKDVSDKLSKVENALEHCQAELRRLNNTLSAERDRLEVELINTKLQVAQLSTEIDWLRPRARSANKA